METQEERAKRKSTYLRYVRSKAKGALTDKVLKEASDRWEEKNTLPLKKKN